MTLIIRSGFAGGSPRMIASTCSMPPITWPQEPTFPSSSPNEVAHILVLRSQFEGGFTSTVRGVFTYRVDDAGLITNLRGYWNMEGMQFGQAPADGE